MAAICTCFLVACMFATMETEAFPEIHTPVFRDVCV